MVSFNKVLKRNGFKRLKKHHTGIIPYGNGKMYVEVYKEDKGRDDFCWAVGGNLKSIQHFPGGYNYHSPEELENELKKVL